MKMRVVMVLAILAATVAVRASEAAQAPHGVTPPGIARQAEEATSDNDDDTVAVQLTVLGIVVGTVFVAGTAAFLLRRRLGLTAYTPPKDAGHQ